MIEGKSGLPALRGGVFGESLPSPLVIAGLLVVGATGYGLSLRLYLLAQRAFGALRTGSVFAFAPFIGAALAIGIGDRSLSWPTAMGAMLMLAGVVLHLAESHSHQHDHAALEHEHAHHHDDGHHDHVHDPLPDGMRTAIGIRMRPTGTSILMSRTRITHIAIDLAVASRATSDTLMRVLGGRRCKRAHGGLHLDARALSRLVLEGQRDRHGLADVHRLLERHQHDVIAARLELDGLVRGQAQRVEQLAFVMTPPCIDDSWISTMPAIGDATLTNAVSEAEVSRMNAPVVR